MARVHDFRNTGDSPRSMHGVVDGGYLIEHVGGQASLIQLETYGSEGRKKPGAASQIIQLDRAAAYRLWSILKEEFGFGS